MLAVMQRQDQWPHRNIEGISIQLLLTRIDTLSGWWGVERDRRQILVEGPRRKSESEGLAGHYKRLPNACIIAMQHLPSATGSSFRPGLSNSVKKSQLGKRTLLGTQSTEGESILSDTSENSEYTAAHYPRSPFDYLRCSRV